MRSNLCPVSASADRSRSSAGRLARLLASVLAQPGVRLLTRLTSIGTSLDVTAEEIHIESYFRADDASEAALRALAAVG